MNAHRIVALDIGNTNTDIALFENSQLVHTDFLPSSAEYAEKICRIASRWNELQRLDRVLIASVVPALGDLLGTLLTALLQEAPVRVEEFKTRLLPVRVDRPESVGVDRLVNCYGAVHLFGAPAIVISLGTATTFEAISAAGEYVGGAIAPGVKISLEALAQRAALLPQVFLKKPARLIAKNTVEHMESGIYYGTVSLIEGMVRRMKEELGPETKVIGTGGLSHAFAGEGVFDRHEPQLTLKSLERIGRKLGSGNDAFSESNKSGV